MTVFLALSHADRAAALRISASIMSTRESSKENNIFVDKVNKEAKVNISRLYL
jgi:hypothetical protein